VASASASPESEPTTAATAAPETSVNTDLLPGVALVTEEVAPGVLRVISDGVRDLSMPVVGDFQNRGPSSRIVVAPDGSVWVFGSQEFFRLGEARSHEGMRWNSIDVDADGTIWALLGRGADYRHKTLSTFDGERWDGKASKVLDFELHPDGSTWIAVDSRVDAGDWDELGGVVVSGGGSGAFAISPLGPRDSDADYVGWLVDGQGSLQQLEFDSSGRGSSDPGTTTDGSAVAVGYGNDGSSWVHLRFDLPVMTGDTLTTESRYFLAHFRDSSQGGDPDATYESEVTSRFLLEFKGRVNGDHLAVAPDGSVWLASDDGLARFDGQTWTWPIRGRIVEGFDIAPDGTVWAQANDVLDPRLEDEEDATINTYVITPEAVAVTE
jgi:hypothetical protein